MMPLSHVRRLCPGRYCGELLRHSETYRSDRICPNPDNVSPSRLICRHRMIHGRSWNWASRSGGTTLDSFVARSVHADARQLLRNLQGVGHSLFHGPGEVLGGSASWTLMTHLHQDIPAPTIPPARCRRREVTATFLYDADGNRVKGTVGGVTTVYAVGQAGRVVRVPERRDHEILRRRGDQTHRLRDRQRRLLHHERPVALDQRTGQPERHGQEPELLLSLWRESTVGSAFSGITTRAVHGAVS